MGVFNARQRYLFRWLCCLGSLASITIASVLTLLWGSEAFGAAMLAGSICLVVSMYFALKVFSLSGATRARKVLGTIYGSEAVKLVLFACLVGGVIKLNQFHAKAFIIALVVNQLVLTFSCLAMKLPLGVRKI